MHELSLVAGLFPILEEKAGEQGAKSVTFVRLRVGRLSGVVPELLESAFDAYKKGTLAERAAIEVVLVPLKVRCRACSKIMELEEPVFACTGCDGNDLEILEGRDIFLDRLEIEV